MLALDSRESLNQSAVWLIYLCIISHLPPALWSDLIISFFLLFLMASLQHLICLSWPSLTTTCKLIFTRLIWAKQRATAALPVAQCSAAGRQAFAKLWAYNTQAHTACWHWYIHMGSQKYERRNEKNNSIYSQLTQPQPKAASSHHNGIFFFTNSADRWGCLFATSWWNFFPPFVLFVYFYNRGNKNVRGEGDRLCGWQEMRELGDTLTDVKMST